MNVLFISPSPLTRLVRGGIERATELLGRELMRRGHEVVVAYYSTARAERELLTEGIRQIAFPDPKSGTHHDTAQNAVFFEKILSEEKIDVVIFQCGAGWYFPFAREVRKFGTPVVSVIHTDPFSYFYRYKHRRFRWLNTFTKFLRQRRKFSYNCKVCATTVLLSESARPRLEMHLPRRLAARSKIVAIPNIATFSAEPVDFSAKKKELLWVGRMEFFQKRPDFMLQIWHRLQDRFPDWSLRFVGDGDYMTELKALVSSLGLKNVFFEGFRDPTSYYRSAPIFCMTSTYEGFGIVLVEAQAFGCVPVAFESSGPFCDIIEDGVSGVLVPAFDINAYVEKLSELMLNPKLRFSLGSAAQKSIVRFSPEVVGDKFVHLLGGGYRKQELLWVGRMSFADKRPDLMLQAWKLLQDRFPDWKLRFVGDGDYLPKLKELATSLMVKNVSFEGFQNPAPYYRSASIFCLTSAYEGFGLVIVEAQAKGCVPVAFDSFSAVHDIIEDGVSGVLVPAFDIEKYAQKLSELMLDPTLRSNFALNALKSVSKFSLEIIGNRWEGLLCELVQKYKKSVP